MLYRDFGKTGLKLSNLGFGLMRLPVIDNDTSRIDETKALPMVRYAIDHGVNYIDTAWPYHDGKSEEFCARVLKDGYREKVSIGTKLPCWAVKQQSDMNGFLDKQLERLELDQIDLYLLHSLGSESWRAMKAYDYHSFLDDAKKSGKIKYAGFSFHDNLEVFEDIVDDYDWDFCFIQLNFLDFDYQAGVRGLKYAHKKGMGVMLMEPLRGGMLARTEVPPEIQVIWDQADQTRTPAEWALRSVWNLPETSVVLSGMTTMEQVVENVKTASEAEPESLTDKELSLIGRVTGAFRDRISVDCTNCRYCMPCPAGVNIPELFWALNHATLFDDHEKAKFWVNDFLKAEERPSVCVECGECEEHCPQKISIMKTLKEIGEKYEVNNNNLT